MRNIKLTIRFCGTAYHGWQIQNNGITVQKILMDAIAAVTGEDRIKLIGCGRTDAGVHAAMYVANFFTGVLIPCERLPLAINSKLPDDIVCLSAQDVSDDFDASGSAIKKTYTYRIYNGYIHDPFVFPYVHHEKQKLDIDKMKLAAKAFLGTHDFVGFAASGYTVKTTVRTIHSLEITKTDNLITIDVTGNGFLYNMVRIIAGTLIAVGAGRIDPLEIEDIINSKNRERAGATAPAKGLCLSEVYYNEL